MQKVQNNRYMLLQGDCLELMPKLKAGIVDLVLTDPPYGMNFQSGYRNKKYKKIKNDTDLNWLCAYVPVLFRLMADTSALYSFSSFHNLDIFKQAYATKIRIKNCLVWEKNNTSMGDLKGDFAPKVEFILLGTKGRPKIRGKREPNIFQFARTNNKLHPTQKPTDLLEYLITKFSDEHQVILDPFMGSGSTGVACINTNRKFIGIEQDERYFQIAADRIENAKWEYNAKDN